MGDFLALLRAAQPARLVALRSDLPAFPVSYLAFVMLVHIASKSLPAPCLSTPMRVG